MDSNTFTSIFIKLRERLKAVSQKYLEEEDDVDDALQEMFMRLWTISGKYDSESQAVGAMITTVKNISIDSLRNAAKHAKTDIDNIQDSPEPENTVSDTIADIDDIIKSELTTQQRQILYQRDRDGWEYEEIAKFHNLSETNIRVILSRTRKKVRDIYNKQYGKH